MASFSKMWMLLTREQRRSAVALLVLMFIGMVLETLGIGLVVPILALTTRTAGAARSPGLGRLLGKLPNLDQGHLVMAGMLILVAVSTVKALFLTVLAGLQMRFVFGVQAQMSHRLFAGYLCQPYSFHLQRNSAQLIRNISNETGLFANTGLTWGLALITEILVVVGVGILLLLVAPLGALIVISILGIAAGFSHRVTHNRTLQWGKNRQLHDGLRIQYLQEGLAGAKDVKLLGRESEFVAQYDLHNAGSARMAQRLHTLQLLPRIWLELLAICGLAGLVIVMLEQHKPMESVLPTLGLFAAAAFRLMPSATRILTAVHNVRYALPVIGVLRQEFDLLGTEAPRKPARALQFDHAIALEQVSFQYAEADRPSVREVSLSIAKGSAVGLIGGSGAGKSTLVDIILGLLTPTGGAVRVDGVDIQSNLRGWQDRIGYVPQSIFLTDDSLRRNIAFGLANEQIDDAAVWRAVRAAQLEEYIAELPHGIETLVGERGVRLSGGQLQRVGIARALYHDPSVLVLDEATSSLDAGTERGVMSAVRALHGDKTAIIVAHRLSTVEHCDWLYRIEDGRLVEGGEPARVISNLVRAQ